MNLFASILNARMAGAAAFFGSFNQLFNWRPSWAANAQQNVGVPPVACPAPLPPQPTCPVAAAITVQLVESLAAVPQVIVKTFFDTMCIPAHRGLAPGILSVPAANTTSYIIDDANRYLSSVPGGGALLNDLVEQVSLRTSTDSTTVRAVILRNFNTSGALVWRGSEGTTQESTVSKMASSLTRLGYKDLRYDYRLTAIPQRSDVAALVAFDAAGNPVVLCYPVGRGQVDDPLHREAAYFQAAAVSPTQSARYIWVSDGYIDFFFDSQAQAVLTELPALVAAAA